MQQERIYTKQEVRQLKRGQSLYPPVIVNFITGRSMLFHDAEGGSIRIADDVTPDDAVAIWVEYQLKQQVFKGSAQYQIASSSGSTYTVTLQNNNWSCTCPGFGFRKRCRHLEQAKQQHQ
jgi:hypothetical protein